MDVMVRGNTKLGKAVKIFNLPPVSTCTPTAWCKERCYALRGKHGLPNVKKGSATRLKWSKRKDFVTRAIKDIGKAEYVRIHASGDFYSEVYVQKWIDIALACPGTLFLAFTKRSDLAGPLKVLSKLPNVKVRQSLDKSFTKPTMGLRFAAVDNFKTPRRKNIINCAGGCPDCGYKCWRENMDVVLPEH